jgi:hypothetical protein
MVIRNQKDFWAGALFLVTGLGFVVLSQDYTMGTAAKMGPAYFPTILGGMMALLGLLIMIPSVGRHRPEERIGKVDFRTIGMVLLSVIVYAFTLPTLGFIVALSLLIFISSLASHEFNLKSTTISILVLLVGSWLVFVKGLELQFPFLPVFLTH